MDYITFISGMLMFSMTRFWTMWNWFLWIVLYV